MIYDFAHIKTIDPILEAIKGKPEFIVAERGWYNIVNYMVNMEDTFAPITKNSNAKDVERATLLRECRGIAFNDKGEILSRPYNKFFNLNERHETQARLIDFTDPHILLDKLDGSMVRPLFNEKYNGFRLATKMGVTDVAMNAEVFVASRPNYFAFFRKCYDLGLSPIFEWCSQKNRIVIAYKEDDLVLTSVRGLHDGAYMPYEMMKSFAAKHNINVVAGNGQISDVESFVKTTLNTFQNIEGFIVRFDNGHMLKIKTEEYCLQHKSKDIVSNKRQVVDLVLNEKIDDIKPLLIEADLEKVNRVEKEVAETILHLSAKLEAVHKKYHRMDRKNFAMNVANNLPAFERKGFFAMLDGKNSVDLVRNFLKSHMGSNIKFDTMRNELDILQAPYLEAVE